MLKVMITSIAMSLVTASSAIAQSPLCYQVTSKGRTVDLSSLCNPRTKQSPIAVTDLSLEVPDEEFLSSRVKAKLTNRSDRPVQVGVVMLQISSSSTPISAVPLFVNQVLSPGQTISTSSIFDKADLRGQDAKELIVTVQSVK